jgi:hypothetical protein
VCRKNGGKTMTNDEGMVVSHGKEIENMVKSPGKT